MKITILFLLASLGAHIIFAQGDLEEQFESFLETRLDSAGYYSFTPVCRVDTAFAEDPDTGELVAVVNTSMYALSKDKESAVDFSNDIVVAPFLVGIYIYSGEVVGATKSWLEFDPNNDWEILNIRDDESDSYWKKKGECWEPSN